MNFPWLVQHVQCLVNSRNCPYYLQSSDLTVHGFNVCLGDLVSILQMLFMKQQFFTGIA